MSRREEPLQRLRAAWMNPAMREAFAEVLPAYLVQRTLLSLCMVAGTVLAPIERDWHAFPRVLALDVWLRWDSRYYLQIAAIGYGPSLWGPTESFFPLYPWLVRGVAMVMPIPVAALLVTNLAAVLALALLYVFAKSLADAPSARRTIWFALLFPTSFFLTAAYSESTYLCAAIGLTIAWQHGRHALAAACLVLGCLARPTGVVCLTVPFIVGWLIRGAKRAELPWFVFAAPIGVAILLQTYYRATGDPMAFLHAPQVEALAWNRSPHWIQVLADEGVGPNLARRILNWSAIVLVAIGFGHYAWKRRIELALLIALPVLAPLLVQHTIFDASSMARYAIGGFPLFPMLASTFRDESRLRTRGVLLGFQMAQVVLATVFASWRWAE